MAFLIGDTEDIASDGTGSLSIGVRIAGVATNFLTINDGDDGVVKLLKNLNANSNDILNADRFQMSGGTTSATSVNDVVWYLDSAGDLISNVNAGDGWGWSSGNVTKMILTDSTLEKRNVTAPSFQLYNTRSAATGTAATMSFMANTTDSPAVGVSMAFLIGDTENFGSGT